MASQEKKKLCWNCEGSVSKSQETCPYCGVYLSPQGLDNDAITTSPFKKSKVEEEIPAPPYQPEEAIHADASQDAQQEDKELLVPLASLMGGVLLAMFGLVIYFFSTNGRLTLSWDSDWGLIFLAVSIPLLYIGYRGSTQ